MSVSSVCILSPSEIDLYVQTLKPQAIVDLGNERWLEYHERCQKLYQQATADAVSLRYEHIKDALVAHEKTHVLVHEAILINVWKQKILPYLWNFVPEPKSILVAYTILYHEMVMVTLLELLMYHDEGSVSLGDLAADLLEYAYDYISELLVDDARKYDDECLQILPPKIELVKQMTECTFQIKFRCLSIMRYLTEHSDKIALSLVSKLYETYDIPILSVQLLMKRPWKRNNKTFDNGKWVDVKEDAISLTEVQVWLTTRSLLLDNACKTYYCITDGRKQQLLKLLPLLTPVLLDQVSPLVELKYWLCQLSVANPNVNIQTKPILVEVMLNVKNNILREIRGKCKSIAKQQVGHIFGLNRREFLKFSERIVSGYDYSLLEAFQNLRNCPECGAKAIHRCSRCQNEFYCSRECQVAQWNKTHKKVCRKNDNVK